jgi:hypothetical protein
MVSPLRGFFPFIFPTFNPGLPPWARLFRPPGFIFSASSAGRSLALAGRSTGFIRYWGDLIRILNLLHVILITDSRQPAEPAGQPAEASVTKYATVLISPAALEFNRPSQPTRGPKKTRPAGLQAAAAIIFTVPPFHDLITLPPLHFSLFSFVPIRVIRGPTGPFYFLFSLRNAASPLSTSS